LVQSFGPDCLRANRILKIPAIKADLAGIFFISTSVNEFDLMISRHDAVEKVKGKLQRANSLRTRCKVAKAKLEYEDVEQM